MDEALRILLVTHYYADHQGGVEIVAGELASRLVDHHCQITWAASGPAPSLREGIRPLPMRAWNVAERRLGFPYPLWTPASLRELARAVAAADVVHLHDSLYLGNVAAYHAARRLGKPVVVTQHVGEIPYRSIALRSLLWTANHTLARCVLGGCTQAVFIAEQVRRFFSAFVPFQQAPLLTPNGVDLDNFQPADADQRRRLRQMLGLRDDRPALLFVGRFVEKKGLAVLRTLAERFAQCDWLFVGWGPSDPADWRLPNVKAIGRVDHARLVDYYRAADLLVLPSTGEGFPLVVQEAMACGTPALISRETASGCPGIDAVAWTAEPNTTSFAERLSAIFASPDVLQSRRTDVADFAQAHWDWDRCAMQYAELFHELANDVRKVRNAACGMRS
ncbi:MAG TPA: glycosyltransferase family 4 protein [Pirellulales bacterium]